MSNVVVALAGQVINFVALASAAIVLPRLLGPDGYGLFSAYLAVVSMLLVVSSLGMPYLEVRFLPPLRRVDRLGELVELTSTLWGVRLAGGVFSAAVCVLWIHRSGLGAGVKITVAVGLFALSRYAFVGVRSLLLPLSRVRWYVGLEVTQSVLFLVAFAIGYSLAGLEGGFAASAGVTLGLLVFATGLVRAEVPLSPRRIRPALLRPLLGHGLHAFVGSVATAAKLGLPVWAVATWAGVREAGYFGLSMQVLGLVTGMAFAARQAVMPILVELQDAGQEDRVVLWVGWLMRASLAVLTAGTLVWALMGREVAVWVLGDAYAPVYGPVTWILIAAVATVAGAMPNGLLFLRKRSRIAAENLVAASVLALAGVAFVLARNGGGMEPGASAMGAAIAVALSAVLFMFIAHLRVWRGGAHRLPLARSVALMLPLSLIWPASQWSADLAVRCVAVGVFLLVYFVVAVATRLLDLKSLRYLFELAMGRVDFGADSSSGSVGESASDSAM